MRSVLLVSLSSTPRADPLPRARRPRDDRGRRLQAAGLCLCDLELQERDAEGRTQLKLMSVEIEILAVPTSLGAQSSLCSAFRVRTSLESA